MTTQRGTCQECGEPDVLLYFCSLIEDTDGVACHVCIEFYENQNAARRERQLDALDRAIESYEID